MDNYRVWVVDEFGTSCGLSACGGECKTFRGNENPDRIKAAFSSHTNLSSARLA